MRQVFTNNEYIILKLLKHSEEISLADLAQKSCIARSSVHAALQSLQSQNIIVAIKTESKNLYKLSSRSSLERLAQQRNILFREAIFSDKTVSKPKLAFTDNWHLPAQQIKELQTIYDVQCFQNVPGFVDDDLFLERSKNADVVVRFDFGAIDHQYLEAVSDLKAIVMPNCYPLNVDFQACKDFGVMVKYPDPVYQKYYSSRQVEYALQMVFTLLSPLRSSADLVNYDWAKNDGDDLFGKRLGVVAGRSNIRSIVEVFRLLGCEVRASNSLVSPPLPMDSGLGGYQSLDDLWDWADVLICIDGVEADLEPLMQGSCPEHLIIMSASVDFNLDTAHKALEDGRLKGLAIDQMQQNWLSEFDEADLAKQLKKLNRLPNVYITPELGVSSHKTLLISQSFVFDGLFEVRSQLD